MPSSSSQIAADANDGSADSTAPSTAPSATGGKWPKRFPPLTPEQQHISNDFMQYWHEVLPKKFGSIEKFNHGYALKHTQPNFRRTLEIGAGLGEHLEHELTIMSQEQTSNYYALELRENMSTKIAQRFPQVNSITGDCQARLDFADGFFDRLLAIHVLEHLPDLPACVREMYRLCDKNTGFFSIVIPCEGSMAYSLARKISAQRIFEKRYQQSYKWFIEREHINKPGEILEELNPYFVPVQNSFYPLRVPLLFCNLVIGVTLKPRPQPLLGK